MADLPLRTGYMFLARLDAPGWAAPAVLRADCWIGLGADWAGVGPLDGDICWLAFKVDICAAPLTGEEPGCANALLVLVADPIA